MIVAAAKFVRWITSSVGLTVAVVVVICILALGWKCSSDRGVRANADRRVAEGQVDVHEKAADLTAEQVQAERDNAALTDRNRDEILGAENANDDSGEVGRAQLRALCRRRVYYDEPQCVELRRGDHAQPQG